MAKTPSHRSRMAPAVEKALNDQIQAEFESAYLYLQMAAQFEALNLKGFAHWLRLQWQEETAHAMKLFDFTLQRDGGIALEAIPKPKVKFKTPTEAFEQVLEHERYITGRIHELYEVAREHKDYPLQSLLHWFIDEQVEEEDNARSIIDTLQLVGNDGANLFLLDRELGARTTAPDA
ncbi:MAG: ferritin [Rhodothermales bacterium]